MAWRRPGDKPLSEPMLDSLPTHICVLRTQWVERRICCITRREKFWTRDNIRIMRTNAINILPIMYKLYQASYIDHTICTKPKSFLEFSANNSENTLPVCTICDNINDSYRMFIVFRQNIASGIMSRWVRFCQLAIYATSNYVIFDLDNNNGLLPDRSQTIIWINNGKLLFRHLGTDLSKTIIEVRTCFPTKPIANFVSVLMY